MPDIRPAASFRPTLSVVLRTALAWAVLVCAILLVLHAGNSTPAPLPRTAPPAEFSARRAMDLLPSIAAAPHPSGSAEIANIRASLIHQLRGLGLQVTADPVDAISFQDSFEDHHVFAGRVTNILGRLPGTASTRPLLLTTHYDSPEHSPAAGSDAAGIAVLFETLRALRSGPPLRNDLLILLTDGQQRHHLGANYLETHADPRILAAGAMLDISNRGNRGVPLLYRTSDGNRPLFNVFRQTAPYPDGASSLNDVTDLLNDPSDFDSLRAVVPDPDAHRSFPGLPGLSFGALSGSSVALTPLDTVANLDPGSLQQIGANTLALSRSLGNTDLSANPMRPPSKDDAVFFNLPSHRSVGYSRRTALLFTAVGVFLFLIPLGRAKRAGLLRPRPFLKAFCAAFFLLLLGPVVAAVLDWIVSRITPATLFPSTPSGRLLLYLSFLLLTLGVHLCVFRRFRRALPLATFVFAALTLDGILVFDLTFALPLSSYLVFWPWVGAALLYGFLYTRTSAASRNSDATARTRTGLPPVPAVSGADGFAPSLLHRFGIWIAALPALLLLPFFFALLYRVAALDLPLGVVSGLLLSGTFVCFLPIANELAPPQLAQATPLAVIAIAGVFGIAGFTLRHPSPTHPRADSISYAVNTDTHRAAWVSFDNPGLVPFDTWTRQALTPRPHRGRLPHLLAGYGSLVDWSPAPLPPAPPQPPSIQILENHGTGSLPGTNSHPDSGPDRFLHLRITGTRNARELRLHLYAAYLYAIQVNGTSQVIYDPLRPKTPEELKNPDVYTPPVDWGIRLSGYGQEPVDVYLHIRTGECRLMTGERLPGLPDLPGHPLAARPPQYMQGAETDDTITSSTLSFCS